MNTKVKIKISLEVEVDVFGEYSKGYPGVMYYGNGDPGYEEEPASFTIFEVQWDGLDITEKLSDMGFDFDSLESDCLEELELKNNPGDEKV